MVFSDDCVSGTDAQGTIRKDIPEGRGCPAQELAHYSLGSGEALRVSVWGIEQTSQKSISGNELDH